MENFGQALVNAGVFAAAQAMRAATKAKRGKPRAKSKAAPSNGNGKSQPSNRERIGGKWSGILVTIPSPLAGKLGGYVSLAPVKGGKVEMFFCGLPGQNVKPGEKVVAEVSVFEMLKDGVRESISVTAVVSKSSGRPGHELVVHPTAGLFKEKPETVFSCPTPQKQGNGVVEIRTRSVPKAHEREHRPE